MKKRGGLFIILIVVMSLTFTSAAIINMSDGFSTAAIGSDTTYGITTNGSDFWITDYNTGAFVYHTNNSGDNMTGGLQIRGYSDDAITGAIQLIGYMSDATGSIRPVRINAYKQSGANVVALAATEKIFDIINGGSTYLLTVLGNGNLGLGTTNPESKLTVVGNTNITGNLTVGYNANITNNLNVGKNITMNINQTICFGSTCETYIFVNDTTMVFGV